MLLGKLETVILVNYFVYSFFVVEDTIMHTCQSTKGDIEGLMSQVVLDDFWEIATSKLLSVIRQHCVSLIAQFWLF